MVDFVHAPTLLSPSLTLLQVGSILINLGTVCGVIERGTDQKSSCAPVLKRLLITECHEAGPQQALSRFAREQQAPYQVLLCCGTLAISPLQHIAQMCILCRKYREWQCGVGLFVVGNALNFVSFGKLSLNGIVVA